MTLKAALPGLLGGMVRRAERTLGTAAEVKMATRAKTDAGNSGTPPTDELIRDYGRRLANANRNLREVMEEAASKRGVIGGIKKAAKRSGVPLNALVRVVAEMLEDQETVVAAEREWVRVRAIMAMPVSQGDLFPADALEIGRDPTQVVFLAGQAGYISGSNGNDIDQSNPHRTGTDEWIKFREQWHAGQASLARKFSVTRPHAIRKKRERSAAPDNTAISHPPSSSANVPLYAAV